MKWIKINLTKEDLKQLNATEATIQKTQLLKRIQCIKLKNKGWKHKDLADFFNVCIETISNWIISYRDNGLEGLLDWNNNGRQSAMTKEQQNILKKHNEKKPFDTAKEAQSFIEKKFGFKFHLHYVQKLLKKNFDFHTKKQN